MLIARTGTGLINTWEEIVVKTCFDVNDSILLRIIVSVLIIFSVIRSSHAGEKAKKDYLRIGGAVRYNLYLQDYESPITMDDAQFTWDTWRIDVNARQKGLLFSFEYRFYPTFSTHFIHHGWIGYDFSDRTRVFLGVTQVPFGNLKFASHSWWFVTPYYVGLEDDYDIGIKMTHEVNKWKFAFAYFMQVEPHGPADLEYKYEIPGPGGRNEYVYKQLANNTARYSYDIVPVTGESNEERNQFNVRGTYTFRHGEWGSSEVGISLLYGMLYNRVLHARGMSSWGDHYAFAAHLNGDYGRFNLKAEYVYYNIQADDDDGHLLDIVQMGAYGFGTYPVAAEASMYVAGLSYSLPINFGPISNLTFYNDYTYTAKAVSAFAATQQNILGCMITAGNTYTYCDIASGVNQPWLTDHFGTGLGRGVQDAGWNTRFNINIGYYF